MKSTSLLLILLSLSTCVWAALPVTDGLVMYLDAEDIQGVADGGTVSTWPDKSSAGNDATQSTTDNQPTYIAASSAFEGQPAVRFNGESSWMELESAMVNVGSFTLIAVGNFSQQDTSQYMVAGQDGSGNDRLRIQLDAAIDGSPFLWRVGSSSWQGITTESDTDIHAFGVTATAEGFLDGESIGTADNTSSENPTAFNIGSYNRGEKDFYDGDLAILVLYDTVLSAEEIAEVGTYLMNEALSSGPQVVSNPSPANGAEDIWLGEQVLTWTGPDYSEGMSPRHRVSLSDSFDDVNDSAVTPVELDVNELNLDAPLAYGTTYYWRVDEANETNGWDAGPIWSFATEPYAYAIDSNSITASATSSDGDRTPDKTVDGSGLTDDLHDSEPGNMWISLASDAGPVQIEYAFDRIYCLDQIWIWNSNQNYETFLGFGVQEAMIEVSTDGDTWSTLYENTTIAQGPGLEGAPVSSIIEAHEALAQYVRITCLSNWSGGNNAQYSLSEVRFTQIPLNARLPQPEDTATDVKVTQSLSWRPGRQAVSNEVYIGTDANALSLVDSTTEPIYSPSLVYNQTYYWRVDEVNEAAELPTYTGDVWSFSTPAYQVIDDMESYSASNEIFMTWLDGVEDEDDNNSSQVGHWDPPYVDQDIVYGGEQSMPFFYTNEDADMIAEAVMTVDGEDWTLGGVQTLTLFFLGDRGNEGGSLYVQINNAKVVCDSDLNLGLWKQWNIDLSEFNTDLTNVTSMTLGVDGIGEGVVYIDEIRLYVEADEVVEASDPGDDNLVLWYEFEDNLNDSSGSGLTASSELTLFYQESLIDGQLDLGTAVSLDGSQHIDAPVGSLISGLTDSTYSIWFNIDVESTGSYMRAFDFGDDTTNYMFLCVRNSTGGAPQFGISSPNSASGEEQDVNGDAGLTAGWHHLAVVFAGSTLSLYADGILLESDTTDTLPADLGVTTNNWFGQSQYEADSLYEGLLDEFKIFNRALSEGEVRYLAGDR